ncbi:MAG: DUF2281 domain-containing protein [Treponematales bacterium]|jgi:hypothetical protein
MTRTLCVPKEDQIVLPIPHNYVGEELEVLVFPLSETVTTTKKQKRKPGCARGQIWMADDFDAPLEEFKDYM